MDPTPARTDWTAPDLARAAQVFVPEPADLPPGACGDPGCRAALHAELARQRTLQAAEHTKQARLKALAPVFRWIAWSVVIGTGFVGAARDPHFPWRVLIVCGTGMAALAWLADRFLARALAQAVARRRAGGEFPSARGAV